MKGKTDEIPSVPADPDAGSSMHEDTIQSARIAVANTCRKFAESYPFGHPKSVATDQPGTLTVEQCISGGRMAAGLRFTHKEPRYEQHAHSAGLENDEVLRGVAKPKR